MSPASSNNAPGGAGRGRPGRDPSAPRPPSPPQHPAAVRAPARPAPPSPASGPRPSSTSAPPWRSSSASRRGSACHAFDGFQKPSQEDDHGATKPRGPAAQAAIDSNTGRSSQSGRALGRHRLRLPPKRLRLPCESPTLRRMTTTSTRRRRRCSYIRSSTPTIRTRRLHNRACWMMTTTTKTSLRPRFISARTEETGRRTRSRPSQRLSSRHSNWPHSRRHSNLPPQQPAPAPQQPVAQQAQDFQPPGLGASAGPPRPDPRMLKTQQLSAIHMSPGGQTGPGVATPAGDPMATFVDPDAAPVWLKALALSSVVSALTVLGVLGWDAHLPALKTVRVPYCSQPKLDSGSGLVDQAKANPPLLVVDSGDQYKSSPIVIARMLESFAR